MNKMMSEQSVKDALGITDWRSLSKDKLMNFVSVLPQVDSEVAMKIIDQFPEVAKTSQEMVNCMKETCNTVLLENKNSSDQSMKAYQHILEDLSELLKKDNITTDDKKYFIEKMMQIADKISDKDKENKAFWGKLLNTLGGVALGTLVIGASILGANIIDKNKK